MPQRNLNIHKDTVTAMTDKLYDEIQYGGPKNEENIASFQDCSQRKLLSIDVLKP